MKTPTPERSVEEIVEDFYEQDFIGYSKQHNELTISPTVADWLTQTLQTERQKRDEVVEAERERIVRLLVELGYKIVVPHLDDTVEEFVTKEEMLALTQPNNPK